MSNPDVYDDYRARAHREHVDVAIGCPGGPGHPSPASATLVDGTVHDIIEAVEYLPRFNHDVKPGLLVVCQCELAEIIQALAEQVQAARLDAER